VTDLVPQGFRARVATYPPDEVNPTAWYAVAGEAWLRRLPGLLTELLEEWSLSVDGGVRWGVAAVAVPVHSPVGPAVLKVTWPHSEALTEHLGLRQWNGRGAVRLLRADPHRFALLLERLDPATDLRSVPVDAACGIIGDLLGQLRSPALPQVPTLSAYAARQLSKPRPPVDVLPRRFVEQARRLAADLTADPDVDAYLLHTDLHYENVLRGTRQSWLAIDPKPTAGDRAFEVAPALWNRTDELGTGSSVRANLRRRLEIVCEHAGIEQDRARAWTIVREADNATDPAEGPRRTSLAVAVIKAMND
jgi:streptomycin 6-kinase